MIRRLIRWLLRHKPPAHYTAPPATNAERDARLAQMIREIER